MCACVNMHVGSRLYFLWALLLIVPTRWGGGSYPSAEKQSVYSTTPADWATETTESAYIVPAFVYVYVLQL